jgi:hypothetical protein
MRIILIILASVSFLSAGAQKNLPFSSLDYTQWRPLPSQSPDSGFAGHKWYVQKYAGLSAGTVFFGGSASYLSAPIGLQLTRPLNNNLYGFAGVSVAPTFFSFSRLYHDPGFKTNYPGLQNVYGLGLSSRVEAGLMYVNDARTFSISGSFGIERSSYPVHPPDGAGKKNP